MSKREEAQQPIRCKDCKCLIQFKSPMIREPFKFSQHIDDCLCNECWKIASYSRKETLMSCVYRDMTVNELRDRINPFNREEIMEEIIERRAEEDRKQQIRMTNAILSTQYNSQDANLLGIPYLANSPIVTGTNQPRQGGNGKPCPIAPPKSNLCPIKPVSVNDPCPPLPLFLHPEYVETICNIDIESVHIDLSGKPKIIIKGKDGSCTIT